MLQLSPLLAVGAPAPRWPAPCVAVVLGVAFLAGTLVLGDTLAANFDRLFTETSAGHRRRRPQRDQRRVDDDPGPTRGPIHESTASTPSRAVDGVAVAEPQVVGYGAAARRGRRPDRRQRPTAPGRQLGRATPELNPYRLVEGRAPRRRTRSSSTEAPPRPATCDVGDTTVVQTPEPVDVTIVGIATFGDADGLGETTFTAFDLARAQQQRARRAAARSTSILVAGADGVSTPTSCADRIAAALPDGRRGDHRRRAHRRAARRISASSTCSATFLVVFAGIALVVAVLSINNTFTITVASGPASWRCCGPSAPRGGRCAGS